MQKLLCWIFGHKWWWDANGLEIHGMSHLKATCLKCGSQYP